MKSTRNLRLRLRLMECALLLLLGVLATAAVSTHQLLLDAANHPTGPVDLADPHWTGTLDAARLPGVAEGAPFLGLDPNDHATLTLPFNATTLLLAPSQSIDLSQGSVVLPILDDITVYSLDVAYPSMFDNGEMYTDGVGDLYCVTVNASGLNLTGAGNFPNGAGFYGAAAPSAQPATPTTLAEVITLLQAYGLCQ